MKQERADPHAEAPGDGECVCGVCGRRFADEDALRRHVEDVGLLY